MVKCCVDMRCPDCGGPRGKDGPRCPACLAKIRAMIDNDCVRDCRSARKPDPNVIRHTNGLAEIRGHYNPTMSARLSEGFRMLRGDG